LLLFNLKITATVFQLLTHYILTHTISEHSNTRVFKHSNTRTTICI